MITTNCLFRIEHHYRPPGTEMECVPLHANPGVVAIPLAATLCQVCAAARYGVAPTMVRDGIEWPAQGDLVLVARRAQGGTCAGCAQVWVRITSYDFLTKKYLVEYGRQTDGALATVWVDAEVAYNEYNEALRDFSRGSEP